MYVLNPPNNVNLEVPASDSLKDVKLGVKRPAPESDVQEGENKENVSVAQNGKRAKEAESPDGQKEVKLSQKQTSTGSLAQKAVDDEEEEVIDTSGSKKAPKTLPAEEKRVPKPAKETEEEEKVAEGTIKEMVKGAEDDEEPENEFNMEEKDYQKLKEGDEESEDDEKVSLDEENIDELQNEEDFDLQDYLKYREQEGV